MKFKIHRGSNEIGGSCVEVWTENTRILLDFGMPLIEKDGKDFNFNRYKELSSKELVEKGVLPNIQGLYDHSDCMIDGVIISHAHLDHYGLINFIQDDVQYYLGEATHEIIELSNIFTPQDIHLKNTKYFEKERTFIIGDISIKPYWMDHSAFDAYSFLVEANGKSLFYSGDFRSHGRKQNLFKWFTHNAPQNVDYLLLEGTTIGRENKRLKSETEIEKELIEVFQQQGKINLIYTSGQNIDRIVSIYKACLKTNKILVVDVYVATILKKLSRFAKIPYPSKGFINLKVMFPYYTCKRLKEMGNKEILFQFRSFKITKEEISNQSDRIVMIVRLSMRKDLENIKEIDGGNLIYSMWEGYLQKYDTENFINYLTNRQFTIHQIHTSGHADTAALREMVEAINPKNIVPIHTLRKGRYKDLFSQNVVQLQDGDIIEL